MQGSNSEIQFRLKKTQALLKTNLYNHFFMCTQMLIFPVPGYTGTVVTQTTVVLWKSQGVRLKESSSSSTQYGSNILHLFLGTNPESQHIINHSVFIYLHLWVPSESMGGAFLICPIRISYLPRGPKSNFRKMRVRFLSSKKREAVSPLLWWPVGCALL